MEKLKRQRVPGTPRRGRAAKRPRVLTGDRQRRIPTGDIEIPARSPPAMGALMEFQRTARLPSQMPRVGIWLNFVVKLTLLSPVTMSANRPAILYRVSCIPCTCRFSHGAPHGWRTAADLCG